MVTLIGAGSEDVQMQHAGFGDTHVFGDVDAAGKLDARMSAVGALVLLIEEVTTAEVPIRSYVQDHLLPGKVPPVSDAPSCINSNRIYAVGGYTWVIQNPRNYTPLNVW